MPPKVRAPLERRRILALIGLQTFDAWTGQSRGRVILRRYFIQP